MATFGPLSGSAATAASYAAKASRSFLYSTAHLAPCASGECRDVGGHPCSA